MRASDRLARDEARGELSAAWWWAAAAVVGAGLILRILGALGPLWLDEIWTLRLLAERAPTPFHIFWSVQHDNVHPLYGVYAWFLGPDPDPLVYRLPAIVLGTGAIAIAGLIGRRRGRAEALIAMALVAGSYPMVHFASEARGYGPMMFCLLTAFWLIGADLRAGTIARRYWVALALTAALLFHVSGALGALALGLWVIAARYRATRSVAAAQGWAVRYFTPVTAAYLALALLFLAAIRANGLDFGGGGSREGFAERFVEQVGEMAKLLLSLPLALPAWAALALVGAAAAALIAYLARRGAQDWPLYALAVLGLPALLFAAASPASAYGRYYLFALVFLLPLAAAGLGAAWRAGVAGKVACAGVLAVMAAGSIQAHALFLAHGRGDGLAVLRFIAEAARPAAGQPVVIAADHRFRLMMSVAPYPVESVGGRRLRVDRVRTYRHGLPPGWVVKHRGPSAAADPAPPPGRVRVGLGTYRLKAVFRHWGLSGFDWMVYQREDAPPKGPQRPAR